MFGNINGLKDFKTITMKILKNEQLEHLKWIYDRMINIHKENKNFDYMHKFLSIIERLNGEPPFKTSDEWKKEYIDVKILDPDGWDRSNFQYSFFEEMIAKEEFEKRVCMSTCLIKK